MKQNKKIGCYESLFISKQLKTENKKYKTDEKKQSIANMNQIQITDILSITKLLKELFSCDFNQTNNIIQKLIMWRTLH